MDEIDHVLVKQYGFTKEEISIVEGNNPPFPP